MLAWLRLRVAGYVVLRYRVIRAILAAMRRGDALISGIAGALVPQNVNRIHTEDLQLMLTIAVRRTLLGMFAALTAASCTGSATAAELLGFRMRDFKSLHMHDAAAADKMVETLKTLRCEVKVSQHGDHKDVAFRTQQWKLLSLKSEEQVAGWEKWLKANGFEVLRSRAVSKEQSAASDKSDAHVEVVQYRATTAKTLHIHQPAAAAEALAIYQALGCKAEQVSHGNHSDLQVTCPEWREIILPNHDTAGSWEKYLKDAGFETKHEHRH